MTRTRLSVLTAAVLVVAAGAAHFTRRATGGTEISGPPGAGSWEVTISARGKFQPEKQKQKKPTGVVSSTPPDFRRQHISDESSRSSQLTHPEGRSDAAKPIHKLEVHWKRRPEVKPDADYHLSYTFRVVLGAHVTTTGMKDRTKELDHNPDQPTDITRQATAKIQCENREIIDKARELGGESPRPQQVRKFFEFAHALPFVHPTTSQSAQECLRAGSGDDLGRCRLLVALCRSRGIPARVITGLILNPDQQPTLHRWAEIWASEDGGEEHWLPADATHGHFGSRKLPNNYLVMRLDDKPLVYGQGKTRVSFFARKLTEGPPADETRIRAFWRITSFGNLPPAEQHLARFLCLLPIGALVVSFFRVVIGVRTFGVFAPALLGLIFRDLKALPLGLGIFTATVLIGWLFRRVLDKYNLLLIPRTAVLLTLVIIFLLGVVVVTSRYGVSITTYIALFPLIILTNMVERFWTMEAEDGTRSSLKTMLGTVIVAVAVAFAVGPDAVGRWMLRFPETLGIVIALQLLLGRYTGYRLTELYRFRDVIEFPAERTKDPLAASQPPNGGKS